MNASRGAWPFLLVLILLLPQQGRADSPILAGRKTVAVPGFGQVTLAIRGWDGGFAPTEFRAIAVDSDGHMLAASPGAVLLSWHCGRPGPAPGCVAYDGLGGRVLVPEPGRWGRGRKIADGQGRALEEDYLDYLDLPYGFSARPATLAEKLSFTVAGMAAAPLPPLLWIGWWCAATAWPARLFWEARRGGWKLLPVKLRAVARVLLAAALSGAMVFLAYHVLLWQPRTIWFMLFAFSCGAAISLLAARRREDRLPGRP